MVNNKTTIQKGSLSFWIKSDAVQYNDGKTMPIASVNPYGGNIFIVKDSDNKLKAFYIALGYGRVDMEFDVSGVDSSKKHMVTMTWNMQEQELNLFFDGEKKVTQKIPFKIRTKTTKRKSMNSDMQMAYA